MQHHFQLRRVAYKLQKARLYEHFAPYQLGLLIIHSSSFYGLYKANELAVHLWC